MGPILLRAENGVFGSFGHTKLHDPLGLDLDGFTGSGVATDPGLAINQHQLAETRNGESILGVLVGKRREVFENLAGLLFADAVLVGDFRCDLRFGQSFCHNMVSSFCVNG